MSSLDEILDSIALEFLEMCQELMVRRSVLDDLLAESSIHLARAQLANNNQCSLALSMLQFSTSLTPAVTVVADGSNSLDNFSEVLLSTEDSDDALGGCSDNKTEGNCVSYGELSGRSEYSCALVCQWDKPPDSNNSGSLIPGTVSKWTSASTPSSVKSAKYYYEKSIEEIVNVASLQNKLENLRKQYRKLRKLKLSRLNESKIDNETPSIAGKGDPKSYEEVEVHPPTISLSGDLLSGIKS